MEKTRQGSPKACAALISLVESGGSHARSLIASLAREGHKRCRVVGITGSPGVGKSTLLDRLIGIFRSRKMRVGVLAVDPSSHRTGGAFLGDRLRMQRHSTDEGVFIRSLATRGASGGLSRSAAAACEVLSAFGCDIVFIETAGVGQTELAVDAVADFVVLVSQACLGDEIQWMKAGILEIADILILNKSSIFEKSIIENELQRLRGTLSIPVVACDALSNTGMEEVARAISNFELRNANLRSEA